MPDPDLCYAALKARDPRFDGRFFTCVATTGIYCRPVCPARLPLKRNCRFVESAAAAQGLGFRPCLRCRPELAPGTSAARGTAAVAGRALKLIAAGALDEAGVEALAERTGLGARHLRRLVRAHAGASPVALARTRRVLFAKRLIAETRLSLTDVAFASGFGSLRRFNAEMKAALGRPPRELRKETGEATAAGPLRFRLPYRPPYDWAGALEHLRLRAVAGVEMVEADAYERRFDGTLGRGRARVTHDPARAALIAEVETDRLDRLDALIARLRAMFDLDADPAAVAESLSPDPVLRPLLAARPGLRVLQSFDPFEAGLRAIVGQQISVKGAITILGRIVAACGRAGFPDAGAVAAADLSGVGLTAARRACVRGFAAAMARPGFADALALDVEGARERLLGLPGVGPWTADYMALRGLADPDAFPAGDLGLRKAYRGLSAVDLERASQAWRPWRAYAATALWSGPQPPLPNGAQR